MGKNLGNTLLPPPPPPRCISLIQSFLETANIFLPIFFEVQFIIKPHDVSRCVWLFDVINNAILRNVFISVFKHSVFLVFDAIWLGHYLRLLSNTHLLLWSENVENRNKKTGVNSLFRSKNLTNKRRGCTWKYKIYIKKKQKYGQYCIGKLFLLGKPVYREITYVYTATNCGDVNGYKCHSHFLTVVSKIKPKCYFFGLTCSVLFALFERT